MSAFTIRRSTFVGVGVSVLLVVGTVAGGTVGTAFEAEASGATPQSDAAADRIIDVQEESDDNNTTVPANQTVESMRAVENRTNGTVVGARLSGDGNGELTRSTFVYEFDVLADNGTRLVAEAYAGNQTVIGVKASNESDGFLSDLFGSDEGVPDEARNLSSLRSGIEAVQIAVNETENDPANVTVTEVTLGRQNDSLAYTVTLFEQGGEPREIVVAAEKGTDGVVTTDPQKRGSHDRPVEAG